MVSSKTSLNILPAGHAQSTRPAGPKIAVCLFVCWSVHTHLSCVQQLPYVHCCLTYHTLVVNISQLQTAALCTGVATVSSPAQLRVPDTEKQRQHSARLTKSGNVRSNQLLTEMITD